MSESNAKPFLSAEWRHLVMLNYACPSEVLQPFVPAGTALDTLIAMPRRFTARSLPPACPSHPIQPFGPTAPRSLFIKVRG